MEAGANLELSQNKGWTPLHAATACAYPDIVSLLIGESANINAADEDGNTSLHLALNENENVFLVYLGNEQRRNASKADREKIADMLLQGGAEIDAKNKSGNTPYDQANDSITNPLRLPLCRLGPYF